MAQESSGDRPRQGLFAALKSLTSTLLATGRTRLALLAVEIEEEKLRVIDSLVSAIAALVLFGLAWILVIACIAAAFWEQRVAVFGLSALLTLGGGLLFASRLRQSLHQPTALFRSSIKELDKDLGALADPPVDRT